MRFQHFINQILLGLVDNFKWEQSRYISLTNRVRGPDRKVRAEISPPSIYGPSAKHAGHTSMGKNWWRWGVFLHWSSCGSFGFKLVSYWPREHTSKIDCFDFKPMRSESKRNRLLYVLITINGHFSKNCSWIFYILFVVLAWNSGDWWYLDNYGTDVEQSGCKFNGYISPLSPFIYFF